MSNVLFVCIGNSGRSVMAERLFRRAARGRHEARSAGAQPDPPVDPTVVEALAEIGVDATDHVPRKLDDDAIKAQDQTRFAQAFDAVTDGCNACHRAANFGFNVVTKPAANPYSNQAFAPPPK